MSKISKKLAGLLSAAVVAAPLVACSTETPESAFDSPLPWGGGGAAYEKLSYSAEIFDTTGGTSESKRVKIADGAVSFVLEERDKYTDLTMNFSVTYGDIEKAGKDAGLTDIISSRVTFHTQSLAAQSMTKTVDLAPREGETDRSYRIIADYFDTRKATYTLIHDDNAKERTISLPRDPGRDNEMMFFLARAQSISTESSTIFDMTNIYDSFLAGELAQYRMNVFARATVKIDLGDWVNAYGIEAVTDDEGAVSYPVKCYETNISINGERSGPPYVVMYARQSFTYKGVEHKKLPLQIEYSQYSGQKPYRHTVYTLTSCSFEK